MRHSEIGRSRVGSPAFAVLLLLGVSAHANPEYDSTALDGNLQNQCTSFSAAIAQGSSLTVSAECNKQDSTTLQATSLDLASQVVWDTSGQAFSWDVTANDNNNITEKCMSVRGFAYSSSDVTLQLTCVIDSTDGGVQQANADLPLNGNVTVGTDGNLARR